MIPDDAKPGMYLVGREDGTVAEFFVQINPRGWLEPAQDHECDILRARDQEGWWWRRIPVPDMMPTQSFLNSLASFPKMRGKK